MNRYSPERQPGESFAGYRARRRATAKPRRIVGVYWDSRKLGTHDPGNTIAKRHASTRLELRDAPEVKPTRTERRAAARNAIPPTWPRTEDQKQQSRPVIVEHPWRAIKAARKWLALRTSQLLPKHALDALAI